MKTVIGEVLSSKPISLKKATSTLSSFISTDNGASPAICAYLRRALTSFKELRQQEKELGGLRSQRRHDRAKSETFSDVSQAPSHKQRRDRPESNITGENPIDPEENPVRRDEGSVGMESERKKHKKKRIIAQGIKEEPKELDLADLNSVEPRSNQRKKKKEKNNDGDFKNNGIRAEDIDDMAKMGIEAIKEVESKKRKSGEVEEKGDYGSEEQRSKKKKRTKTD